MCWYFLDLEIDVISDVRDMSIMVESKDSDVFMMLLKFFKLIFFFDNSSIGLFFIISLEDGCCKKIRINYIFV